MKAKELKGVYNLNPTSMVMKQGSAEERELAGHSAMPTRMGHDKHSTGERRMHEDHHYAVRQMKGKY